MLSVTTVATDLNLLTSAELRAAIGVEDSSKDAALVTLGKRVSSTIAKACKVEADGAVPPTLRLETLTETFRLKSSHVELVLSRRPAISITSVTEDNIALTAADYELEKGSGILRRLDGSDNPSCWAAAKIVVVYPAGWQTVPDDLKLAATKLAAAFWSEGQKIDPSLKRESIPGVIEQEWWVGPSDDPIIPQEVMDLLNAGGYVNHWVS